MGEGKKIVCENVIKYKRTNNQIKICLAIKSRYHQVRIRSRRSGDRKIGPYIGCITTFAAKTSINNMKIK